MQDIEADEFGIHCKAKGGVGRKNCSLGSSVSRGSAPRLTLLPWLQFFLPTPTFALQCFRLISTIQLLHMWEHWFWEHLF